MTDTETRNPDFIDIDRWPTERAVEAMLDGQVAAVEAIRGQAAAIAAAADAAAARLGRSGRLVYAGAGTSGRIAVQDGVELGPTFNWPADRLVYLMAGGMTALADSAEGAEDDADDARRRVHDAAIGPGDVVIAIAASGRTPFTVAVVEAARAAGALTIGVANNPDTPLLEAAEFPVLAATGAELVAGSTRMKAGTAQKTIANLLSTAIMLRLGRVYRGLMVDMVISNDKLLQRARGIVATLAGCGADAAADALERAGRDIKRAVLVARGLPPRDAEALLAAHDGILARAIAASGGEAE
ncbi:N-acetylmuramic acid 6-phosphate etherase [Sphingopyxis sp. DHUNG17]|uniref:N-acetylmuramic acid 6-phosphate etherase n=1 Tax=Sphingopyxis jiangsuensis TaxID=2871171 RepID=UPI00191E2576|nr:N-acetylmuramic acid 6-phosphate etherase [Sphingopyxis lutea]MBL0767956.1 N-acetylmuramic acid 6-phosphate etherase [Sphingopyxis lutea]